MGTYDSIQVPIQGQPISSSLYGVPMRSAVVDLDRRLALVESTLSNYTFKINTTTRASTTTVADDPDLKLFLNANSTYFVEFFLTVAAVVAEDIKTAWGVPAAVTSLNRRVLGPGSTAVDGAADNITGRFGTHNYATTVAYNGVRASNTLQFQVQEVGIIRTAGTAGYVTLQWAQVTSGATGTVVAADSFGRATKVA